MKKIILNDYEILMLGAILDVGLENFLNTVACINNYLGNINSIIDTDYSICDDIIEKIESLYSKLGIEFNIDF